MMLTQLLTLLLTWSASQQLIYTLVYASRLSGTDRADKRELGGEACYSCPHVLPHGSTDASSSCAHVVSSRVFFAQPTTSSWPPAVRVGTRWTGPRACSWSTHSTAFTSSRSVLASLKGFAPRHLCRCA